MANNTSRERVKKTLEHIEPDMIPIDFGGEHTRIHPIAHKRLKKFLGYEEDEEIIQDQISGLSRPDKRIIDLFQVDVISIYTKPPSFWNLEIDPIKDECLNEWGSSFVRPKNGFFYDLKEPAMKDFTIQDLENYDFPDPVDEERFRDLDLEASEINKNTDKALMACSGSLGIFENLWLCRGFEQAYIDIAEKKFAELFFEKMLWWQKSLFNKLLDEIGDLISIIGFSEDLGSQNGPLFNPVTYRDLFKPVQRHLLESIKNKTKAKVYIHSCGSINWAISDFIEIGIDIINPVQVGAYGMDPKILKKEFGKYISFWGGGCDNNILLNGTTKDVEKEVLGRINDLAGGGGFVFAPIHQIQANTPPENIITMFETAIKYRNY